MHLVVEPGGNMGAHVIWLEHASKVLQEGHHPHELFMTQSCATVHPSTFHHKVNVDVLDPIGSLPEYRQDDRTYFVRYYRSRFYVLLGVLLRSMW